jgi:hypothetical protein
MNIEERDYYEAMKREFAAVGNVAVTTENERLFLSQP